jgi:diguanylate cyclase (GGDEF)-like protein
MIEPPDAPNERQRLATLRSLRLLDTPPEERFDRITRLARRLFDVPIALVSLVDAERQWFKSRQGLQACETPRKVSLCGHTILEDRPMIVADASEDERFCDNPLVTGEPHIRFYAGYPLSAPDGSKLGSLCLIDRRARQMSEEDVRSLASLGQMIEAELVALNLATSDALTGLSNLRGFLEIGRHLLAYARSYQHSLQLLYLRLDHLDELHRAHGAACAERTLVEVGQMLQTSFRGSDLIARIGHEEFCVLMSRPEPVAGNPAVRRAEHLLQQLNAERPIDQQVLLRASLVTFAPPRHSSLEEILRDAEQLMKRAAPPAQHYTATG